ncbi:MAG: c-type cytochrome [Rhodocyclaceae bacterium]|nr:c-type cytochrome [Rhodocyclaceae bacterium]
MNIRILAALVAALAIAPSAFAGGPEIAQKAGCLACHTVDKKLVGPSYKDVAAKYKGQGDALAKLSDKVRKGGAGVWGPIPMPPNVVDKISDADLKTVVGWVLTH